MSGLLEVQRIDKSHDEALNTSWTSAFFSFIPLDLFSHWQISQIQDVFNISPSLNP